MEIVMIIIGVIVVGIVITFISIYNNLIGIRNQVKNAWAQIDVQLKRRHDLIPNLVESVKGYMTHERGTLEAVTNARIRAVEGDKNGLVAQARAENQLSEAVSRLFAVAENYPNLKANENFMALQEELASTENKISFSRQFYNDAVLTYNNMIQMFPSNIVAAMGSFVAMEFFRSAEEDKMVPKVTFI